MQKMAAIIVVCGAQQLNSILPQAELRNRKTGLARVGKEMGLAKVGKETGLASLSSSVRPSFIGSKISDTRGCRAISTTFFH